MLVEGAFWGESSQRHEKPFCSWRCLCLNAFQLQEETKPKLSKRCKRLFWSRGGKCALEICAARKSDRGNKFLLGSPPLYTPPPPPPPIPHQSSPLAIWHEDKQRQRKLGHLMMEGGRGHPKRNATQY